LLVSLIQGRKGLAGQLADFYKFVRMSRIAEGTISWGLISVALGFAFAWVGQTTFAGAFFIALIAILFRMVIPGVCWLLLGFFGKRFQDGAEDIEADLSLRVAGWLERRGLVPDHRLLKRVINWLFVGLFVAWVAWSVFEVPYAIGLAIVWLAMAAKAGLEVIAYPYLLPLRHKLDKRFPKPFASYR
jgi:hypothetical protein